LMELIREINFDLEEREKQITRRRSGAPSTSAAESTP
jgi:hypothetical protein